MVKRYPAEILGFEIAKREQIRAAMDSGRPCPFTGTKCVKKNGVCSVRAGDQVVAICPHRFLQGDVVIRDIAHSHFGSESDLLVFNEVYSGERSLGSFDYVIVQHYPMSSEIKDFVIVEFQTVDTTMTGELNQALHDFENGEDITDRSYKFGLNWANVLKRSFIQMLNKGRVLEHWGHKAYWVFQEPTYAYFLEIYGLAPATSPHKDGSTIFMIYDLADSGTGYSLATTRTESTTVSKLLDAFSHNPNVPPVEQFLQRLEHRVKQEFSLKFESE
jgi:hypothetical protein